MLPESVMIIIFDYLSQIRMLDIKKELRSALLVKRIKNIEHKRESSIDRTILILMGCYNKNLLSTIYSDLCNCRCCNKHLNIVTKDIDSYYYVQPDMSITCKCPCLRYKRRIFEVYMI